MKKYLLITAVLFSTLFGYAQSLEDGKKFMYYERWESAEKTLRQLIQQHPQEMDNYYWLATALLEQGKKAEAKQLLASAAEQVAKGAKETPLLKVAAGELLLHDSLHTEATQKFEDALKDTKQKDPEVLMAVARAHLNAKRTNYDYLIDLLDKAAKRDKNNPAIYSMEGEVYRRMGDGGKAVQAYMKALEKDPNYAKAEYSIGKIYLTQQNTEYFLKHFTTAVQKDPAYTPALYELYYYYYFRDVNLAKDYLDKYIAHRDPSVENDYMMIDLMYVSSKHAQALEMAKQLLEKEKEAAQPRLYKLIAYSYDALNDSTKAMEYINTYFEKAVDSQLVAKDFELRAKLLQKFPGNEEKVMADLVKAVEMDTLASNKADYMTRLAGLHKKMGNRSQEAYWLGKLYGVKENATNLDLYNWGLAHYSAQEYPKADSVFALYTEKYPEHIHGYYWRAKSNALIDTTMEQGLAVPHYQKVIELAAVDSIKNKSLLIQAYGYVGAYQANVKKDFEDALAQFSKILELDPQNADAIRYSDILKKWVKNEADKSNESEKSITENK
jgi:tetratricopeptide (TPR) repeat protein